MSTVYDLSALQPAQAAGELLTQSLAIESGGRTVSGVYKLAQRFVITLLTVRGDMPFESARGCRFAEYAALGQALSEFDALAAFNLALLDVGRELTAEDNEDVDPADERFDSAALTDLAITPSVVRLTIVVRSKAGSTATIDLPMTFGTSPFEE